MAKLRWGRHALEVLPGVKLRWSRHTLEGTASTGSKLRWGRHALEGTAGVFVNSIAAQTVEPETTVTLTASLAGGGTPDSWTWRRVSGPAVTLVGTGATRQFIAPSGMPPAGATVVVGVIATVAGTSSAEATVMITVLPQLRWQYEGGAWVGARRAVAL